jgi:hypothetical protein
MFLSSIVLVCSLFVIGSSTGCQHEPPNLSPVAHAQFVGDKYIIALSDFQDGVTVAFHEQWLSKHGTNLIAQALEVIVKGIHESPSGAKAVALKGISELRLKLQAEPNAERYVPYLDSVQAVLEAL